MPPKREYNSDSNESSTENPAVEVKQRKGFATAISEVLKAAPSTTKRPILSKKKGVEKKIDKEKRLEKERKEKRIDNRKNEFHVIPVFDNKELLLKKIATRGVVQLFNALQMAQKASQEDDEKALNSKKVFLDSIKQAKLN